MHVRTVWRIVAAAALVVAAALAPGSAAPAHAEEPPIERTPEFRKRVESAIARGVAWVRTVQVPDGTFDERDSMRETASVLLTLRRCGVPANDPARAKACAWLRAKYDTFASHRESGGFQTEDHALACFALASQAADAAGPGGTIDPAEMAVITDAANVLVKFQTRDGGWCTFLDPTSGKPNLHEAPGAIAALQAARRAGVDVPAAVWTRALKLIRGLQDRKGEPVTPAPGAKPAGPAPRARGWEDRSPGPGSAREQDTAEALTAIAICRSELARSPADAAAAADPKLAAAIQEGLAWLGQNALNLKMLADPQADDVEYYLHSGSLIEAAAGALGAERLGSTDWYGDWAEAVLSHQSADGAWHASRQPPRKGDAQRNLRSTCYALAFLARATPRQPVEAAPAAGDAGIRFDAAPKLPEKEFVDFVDRVLTRWRTPDAAAKDQIASKLTAVGPRIVAPLVLRLASDDAEVRASAIALLKRATGLDHSFDPAAAADARAAAVLRWQAWTKEHAATLHYDAAADRLVP